MAKAKKITVYIVQEITWNYNDEWYYREETLNPDTGESMSRPLQVFQKRENAEVLARQRDLEARQSWGNPFMFCEQLEDMTSLTVDQFWDRVEQLGINRPVVRQGRYWSGYDWWESTRFKPEVATNIWDLFDKIRFYEVVATDLPVGG